MTVLLFLVPSLSKLQVILGRATKETAVDIDLGREGHAGKVSRRQVRFVLAFLICIFVCSDSG